MSVSKGPCFLLITVYTHGCKETKRRLQKGPHFLLNSLLRWHLFKLFGDSLNTNVGSFCLTSSMYLYDLVQDEIYILI